jgi:hypothetical protein
VNPELLLYHSIFLVLLAFGYRATARGFHWNTNPRLRLEKD